MVAYLNKYIYITATGLYMYVFISTCCNIAFHGSLFLILLEVLVILFIMGSIGSVYMSLFCITTTNIILVVYLCTSTYINTAVLLFRAAFLVFNVFLLRELLHYKYSNERELHILLQLLLHIYNIVL